MRRDVRSVSRRGNSTGSDAPPALNWKGGWRVRGHGGGMGVRYRGAWWSIQGWWWCGARRRGAGSVCTLFRRGEARAVVRGPCLGFRRHKLGLLVPPLHNWIRGVIRTGPFDKGASKRKGIGVAGVSREGNDLRVRAALLALVSGSGLPVPACLAVGGFRTTTMGKGGPNFDPIHPPKLQ